MAPEVPNQKRKRGRPAVAPHNAEGASGRVPERDPVGTAQLKPPPNGSKNAVKMTETDPAQKKRGRPRKSTDSVPEDEAHASAEPQDSIMQETAKPRKRGRQGKTQENEPAPEVPDPEEEEDSRPRKRGRRAKGDDNVPEISEAVTETRPRKRGRPSLAAAETEGQQAVEEINDAAKTDKTVAKQPKRSARLVEQSPSGDPVSVQSAESAKDATKSGKTTAKVPKRSTRAAEQPSSGVQAAEQQGERETTANPTEGAAKAAKRSTRAADQPVAEVEASEKQGEPEAPTKPGKGTAKAPKRSTLVTGQPTAEQDSPETSVRRSNRERRSADNSTWWAPKTSTAAPDAVQAAKETDTRPSLGKVSVSEAQNQTDQEPARQQKKKAPKPTQQAAAPTPPAKRKSPRSRKAPIPSTSSAIKKKRKSAARSSNASQNVETPTVASASSRDGSKSKQARKRPSGSGANTANEPSTQNAAAATAETSSPASDHNPKPPPPPKYRHLTSRTRQIPRSTISSKWTALDPSSIAAIDAIVADACRPVLHRLRETHRSSTARHQQAEAILQTFATRLRSKLAKGMPFPPPSAKASVSAAAAAKKENGGAGVGQHEAELDFEKTVGAIQALQEGVLNPLLHSVGLLKAEKEREEAALEGEYRVLRGLEVNARAEAKGWRESLGRRGHLLAPGVRGGGGGGGNGNGSGIGRLDGEGGRGLRLEIARGKGGGQALKDLELEGEDDKGLVALSQQIGSHMESMRGNLQQIEGVLPAIAKSRAALQGVLHRYLDPQQYDQVLLG